jgi:PAS domain S-box-containing protein
MGFCSDITARKQAEAELWEKNQLLDSIVENIPNMIFLKRASDLRFALFNRAGEELLGFRRADLIGRNDYDLFPAEQADCFTSRDRAVLAQDDMVDIAEEPLQTAHGLRTLHTKKLALKDAQGQPQYLLGISEDISERKQAAEALQRSAGQLKEAQRMARIGSWELDLQANALHWSDEVFRIFEIDPAKFAASYEAFLAAIHPDDREAVNRAYTQSLERRQPYSIEHRLQMPDGRIKFVHEQCESFFSPEGRPLRSVGTIQDVTERTQVAEELRRYKDHLEEEVQQRTADLVLARNAAEAANKAKSVFLASMSHELRTPLNAILGFSNMLRQQSALTPEQRGNLDIINRSGEHLLTLINDVLEMAKIEAGRVQVESAPFDLGNLVRDVADMMHVRAQEKGLQLLIDQSSDFPRYIRGDEARLRQVLINLVGNAVKFTQHGGITVRLGMKPQSDPQRLLIEVEDSGVGIAAEDQRRIFEPFVQLGESALQKGTGLGLTITRQFVGLMGGAVEVESTPGQGAVFRVELPLNRVAASEISRVESAVQGEVVGLAPGQPEVRVLIVEDQQENQLLLSALMQRVGIQYRVAENGEQALQLFQSWQPQLVWMDRRMPVMDGMEATRQIRRLPGGDAVKIIAVTASVFIEQREEMLKVGMDGFVRKPYRFEEIYDCLARQLGVKYVYAEENPAVVGVEEIALTPEMVAILPERMRAELRDALESLEAERIATVMAQVSSLDASLGQVLQHLADNYNYPAILGALFPDREGKG